MQRHKLFILLLAIAIGATSILGAQITVSIGDGTSSNTVTGVPNPYGTFYKNFRQQYLYRADEIEDVGGGAGDINSVAFNVQNVNNCSEMPNYRIRLKHTDQTELSTSFETGDYQQVFAQDNYIPVNGWNTHTFSTPFVWNGTQNILVDIVTDFITGSYSQNASVYYTPTTFNSTLRFQNDSNPAIEALTGVISMNRANLRFNMAELTLTDPPNAALAISPGDAATLVSPFTSLVWAAGGGVPSGYRLNFGTNNPPSNIVNNLDLEDATSYTPDPLLAYDTTYFWQIVPYNVIGNATDCPIWSFSTHGDLSITALPYVQDWDAVTVPDLPIDWTAIVNSSNTAAVVATHTSTPHSPPNNLRMYNASDTSAELLLVSPEIDAAIALSSIRVKAWIRSTSSSNTLDLGVMTDPSDAASFETVRTLSFGGTSYSEHIIELSAYSGTGHFIAFRHGVNGSSRNIYLDDIIFEEIAANDLAALNISGNAMPSVNVATDFSVDILNNGTALQDSYSVKLMTSEGVQLAVVAGPGISAGETVSVNLPWTPSLEGVLTVYGEVVLDGDVNAVNNETPRMLISVLPEGVFSVTIGEGTTNQRVPLDFYYKNSLFQSLYYQDEIGIFGNITNLNFYNNFNTALTDMPIKIWLGTTLAEDLSAGWIDPTTLSLVFDGDLSFPAGENTITIPLQTPYNYAGGNLLLYAHHPLHPVAYTSGEQFRSQAIGTNRARKLQSDSTEYDPMAPSAAGSLSGTFPMTTFIMTPLSDEPLFVASPAEYDFGTVLVSSTAQQDFMIANGGGGNLDINSISISGDAAFTLTDLPDLPASLGTGASLSFVLNYSPSTAGEHTAQITITDNITRELHTIDISGNGYDATIYSLPFMEDWDSASTPDFPLGWSYIHNSTATASYLRTSTSSPYSAPNCVQMANSIDSTAELILISPIIDTALDLSSMRIKLMLKGGTNREMQVGTIVDPLDAGTFELAEILNVSSGWEEYIVSLSDHTGVGRYIAIRHGLAGTSHTMYIDDLALEEIAANDLAAVSITGNTTPSVNMATDYTVSVFNNGTATQSDYQVQIVDDEGSILATVAGETVAPNETITLSVSYTPSTEGTRIIMGKVVLAGDVNTMNDTTSPLTILVQAEGVISITIGEGDRNENIPWNFFYKNNLFQSLYYADEFGLFGQITGISLYNNFSNDVNDKPVKLWLGTTNLADLSDGWIDPATLTLVYDGTMSFPSGQNIITISFSAPFDYFSGNLVLYANRPMDTVVHSSTDRFLAQTVGTNRARVLRSDSVIYDPMDPSAAGTLSGTFPKATFFMNVDGMGSLSGMVSAAGEPLANVEISIDDTSYQSSTSALGQYSFSHILEGNYTLSVHKLGYEDQAIAFSIVEGENTTLDIVMQSSTSIDVSGSVAGSDLPTVGLEGAVINLIGATEYTAATNADGQFIIENVLSGNTYTYSVDRAGYQTAHGTITVGLTDYDMGAIILDELTFPPTDITAIMDDAGTAVNLTWSAIPTDLQFIRAQSEVQATQRMSGIKQPVQNTSRMALGYEVWRLESAQEDAPDLWSLLTPVMITDTAFTDPAWASLPDGLYKWAVKTIYTNNLASDAGFSNELRLQPRDLSALSISGNVSPSVGAASDYTIRIKNTGTSAQIAGAYSIKIMSANTQLATIAGPAIAVDQTLDVQVNWIPLEQGPLQIYGKVVLLGDSDPTNDETDPLSLVVRPAGEFAYTVGEGNELANIPVNVWFKSSLFQMIIYPAELDNFLGYVNGMELYNNFLEDLPNIQTKIWIETTTLDNLAAGWVEISDHSSLVFDGEMHYPAGENTISFPFIEPFMYLNGENLLITIQRPLEALAHNLNNKFKVQTIGTNRARRTQSDATEYDPTIAPAAGVVSGQFPKTTLLGTPGAVGRLSGTVTAAADNAALEGVWVRAEGEDSFETTTNALGEYEIPYMLADTYNLLFSKHGYTNYTQTLVLDESEEAVINVNMQLKPTVSVSGTILASDTSEGIATAMFTLSGYADYSANTDGGGEFTLPEVYANESYTYTVQYPGYATATGSIDVGAAPTQIPAITLSEIAYAPHTVVAEVNSTYTAVLLEWEAPDPNEAEMLKSLSPGNRTVKSTTGIKGQGSRFLLGYEVYRFVLGQEENEANWTLVNDGIISTLSYEDENWATLSNGTYRWGVKAVYSEDNISSASLSNPLAKESVDGNIVGFVRRMNGQGITGATVVAGTRETTTNAQGAYSMVLPVGSYSVSASAQGYKTVTVDNVVVAPNQNTTLNITLDTVSGEDELSPVTTTVLKGNSPNPFNPTTQIYYDILEPCNVRLDVYNLKGQKVRSLLNEAKNSGRHSIVFEAHDDSGRALSSGVYFYRFSAGKYNATRKMLLME